MVNNKGDKTMKKNKHKNYKFGVKHQNENNFFKQGPEFEEFFEEMLPMLEEAGCIDEKTCFEKTGKTRRELLLQTAKEFYLKHKKEMDKYMNK